MKRVYKWVGITLATAFVGLQFVGPAKTNATADETRTIEARTNMPPEVAAILRRSCEDCHSSHTNWPWYSNIAPVSWFVINHVNDGRRVMNLSDWAAYDQRKERMYLGRIADAVESGGMPLDSYTLLHHGARLSPADVASLSAWTNQESQRLAVAQSGGRAAGQIE